MAEQVNVLLKELATATQKQNELVARKEKVDAESIEINDWINAIERNRNALINKIATLTPTGTTCASASRLPPLFYMR